MIEAGDLKKGVTLRLDGNLYRVMTTAYNKPGRGTATMRTTLYDLNTGNTVTRIFPAEDRLDNIYVDNERVDYLYSDGETLHFMNPQTYEQYEAPLNLFGDDFLFLKENIQLELRLHEGRVIDYQLPTTLVYNVTEAEVAIAGDTTGKVTKRVKTETGLEVQVPIFVGQGDKIEVDTRDGSYVGRG